jgi:AcrR family transcriptional regulator
MGRRSDPNNTRANEIIRATIRCLARSGFSHLTMKRLSEEAGISQGILHYYFKDKRAILAAAAEHVMSDLDLRAESEFIKTADPKGRLRGMIRACLVVATVDREFWTVFMALWGESLHDSGLAVLNKNTYRRARKSIGGIIERGIESGDFRPVDVLQASAVILALIDGISLQLTFEKKLMSLPDAQRLCETVSLQHLVAPEQEP